MNDTLFYQGNTVRQGIGADQCINCGNCKQHCPQQLEIPELMKKVHKELMREK
jgi:predicted aldo/keto reductase-like oxidoreductase